MSTDDLRSRIAAKVRERDEMAQLPTHEARLLRELRASGWTRKEYDRQLLAQGGLCGCCGAEEGSRRHFRIQVAGVLVCGPCDDGIQAFKFDPHLLDVAAALVRSAAGG